VALPGSGGDAPGAVVVADDLTPLIQAQRVAAWGEVARKLAHEVKNPLTPIQLSAQRVRKAYLRNDAGFDRILTEATRSIVDEVESLKNLVDEFAHFARLPAAQLVPCQLREIIEQTLALYDGPFPEVRFQRAVEPDLPPVRVDPSQMKRLLINLLDNAIEAMERHGTISVEATFDREAGRFRLAVADDGPGISLAQRESLFVPHFSTKKHGGGLGLAMVGRIVQEHRGTVRFEENQPQGARFVVELPG
jgi:two-component system nitrogen regulation sensor histidine kinase NtrY